MKKLIFLSLLTLLSLDVIAQTRYSGEIGCTLEELFHDSWHQVKHEVNGTFQLETKTLNSGDFNSVPKDRLKKDYLKLGDYEYTIIRDWSFLKKEEFDSDRRMIKKVFLADDSSMDDPKRILVRVEFEGEWDDETTRVYLVFIGYHNSCHLLDNSSPILIYTND